MAELDFKFSDDEEKNERNGKKRADFESDSVDQEEGAEKFDEWEAKIALWSRRKRQQNKYDPRPDVETDHYIWMKLLRVAEEIDDRGYQLLHSLRCGACRLKIKKGKLKLDLENSPELVGAWMDKEKLEKLKNSRKMTQTKMFGKSKQDIYNQTKKNRELAKKKKELEKEAVENIKAELLKPNIKRLKVIFAEMHTWMSDLNRRIRGITIEKLNQLLKKKYEE